MKRELPHDVCGDLMYETLMFCWQMVSSNRTVAMTSFAMSSAVVDMIAALTPRDVRAIADRQRSAVQVRWNSDHGFWRDMLQTALDADEGRLSTLHLHAKLMLVGELVSALD